MPEKSCRVIVSVRHHLNGCAGCKVTLFFFLKPRLPKKKNKKKTTKIRWREEGDCGGDGGRVGARVGSEQK